MTYVLGLETSCDETSVALLREDGSIAASVATKTASISGSLTSSSSEV